MPEQSSSLKGFISADRMMNIGKRLQRIPFAWKAAALALRVVSEPRRAKQIEKYLRSNEIRRLRFGSGRHTDVGWLSADLVPLSGSIVFMDARKTLPLLSDSFDFIVCEHMIEHVDLKSARLLLDEFFRVLRPGGVLRLATPDFGRLVQFVVAQDSLDDDTMLYVRTMNDGMTGVPEDDGDNPVYMINRVVRDWGHSFLFDEATLTGLLHRAGFSDVVRSAPGESGHPDLVAVERHNEEIGDRMNLIETLVLEAVAKKKAVGT